MDLSSVFWVTKSDNRRTSAGTLALSPSCLTSGKQLCLPEPQIIVLTSQCGCEGSVRVYEGMWGLAPGYCSVNNNIDHY